MRLYKDHRFLYKMSVGLEVVYVIILETIVTLATGILFLAFLMNWYLTGTSSSTLFMIMSSFAAPLCVWCYYIESLPIFLWIY